jgi:hypothetical protein
VIEDRDILRPGFPNMLMATRDPSLHPGAQVAPPAGAGFTRLMNMLQVAGSLLAIPVGLASGYSIYHANFSVEARCQGLRGNIVSMLDKSADAATLRMLIGRDVAAFERTCGAVDPDAVAAFKTLMTAGKPAAPHAVAQSAPAKPPAKQAKQAKPAADGNPMQRAAVGADAKWLAAVREALVNQHAEPPPVERFEAARLAPPVTVAPPMHAIAAPVASAPPTETDHPVPPALIPEILSPPAMQARNGYRLGALIAQVPFIRGVFGR